MQAVFAFLCTLTTAVASFLLQVQRSVRVPTHTYMRAFELRINTTVINIKLLPPLASKPEVWRIVATANGQPVVSSRTLPNGIKIDRVTGDIGKFGTVKVDAGGRTKSSVTATGPALLLPDVCRMLTDCYAAAVSEMLA